MSGDNSLSFAARLALSEALLKLPDPQFKRLVFALNPPPGILPSDLAALGDRAAREFAVGFYDALGAGRDMEFAFKYACNL